MGNREKWTLFDEATRVPLLIYHPLSPFKGQHYKYPVESIDIYPTVIDLLQAPFAHKKHCPDSTAVVQTCTPLQGKSLAPVVLGHAFNTELTKKQIIKDRRSNHLSFADVPSIPKSRRLFQTNENAELPLKHQQPHHGHSGHGSAGKGKEPKELAAAVPEYQNVNEIQFSHDFAITQFWRCLDKNDFNKINMNTGTVVDTVSNVSPIFGDCSMDEKSWNTDSKKGTSKNNLMLMGYSMRTVDYRYTAWIHFNSSSLTPILDPKHNNSITPHWEELYSHHMNNNNEEMNNNFDYTRSELNNLATLQTRFPAVQSATPEDLTIYHTRSVLLNYRRRLMNFIQKKIIYSGRH